MYEMGRPQRFSLQRDFDHPWHQCSHGRRWPCGVCHALVRVGQGWGLRLRHFQWLCEALAPQTTQSVGVEKYADAHIRVATCSAACGCSFGDVVDERCKGNGGGAYGVGDASVRADLEHSHEGVCGTFGEKCKANFIPFESALVAGGESFSWAMRFVCSVCSGI